MIRFRVRSLCAVLTAGFLLALPIGGRAAGGVWPDPARFADEVFRLTNVQRAAHKLPPFRREKRLDKSAERFSRYMGESGFFEHVGPDGIEPGQRIEKQGYNWSWWGENIAWGYPTPQEVVAGWMSSPGHRANILSANFADLGVGIAFVGGKTYMTQDFATESARSKPEVARGAGRRPAGPRSP